MNDPQGESGYRHELKYFLNNNQYTLLRQKISHTVQMDYNCQKAGGEYFIRSLYFDDPYDSAFRTKLAGEDYRNKYRLRVYDLKDDIIKLECKHKDNSYIKKQSVLLSREECDELLTGGYRFLLNKPEPFAHVLFAAFANMRLRPKVIVDYKREAYTFPVEDVRITFDRDIRTGLYSTDIWRADLPTFSVIDDYDMVLEVKFNKYLPSYIRYLLQLKSAQNSAISKYCLCRRFEL
jgi:hypothetical protein